MSRPLRVSDAVAELLGAGRWESVESGRRHQVWRVDGPPGGQVHFVKVARSAPTDGTARADVGSRALQAEHERLRWLAGSGVAEVVPVPTVVAFDLGDDDHPAVLVTAELPGEADLRFLPTAEAALDALGHTLARLHAVDTGGAPFAAGPDERLAEAGARVRGGLVTPGDLTESFRRISPGRMLELVTTMHPGAVPPTDRVLVHGGLTTSDLLVDPAVGAVTGALGWRSSGVGDRHLDLAVTARSVVRTFGGEAVPRLFEAYGLDDPDPLRLEFYGMLEELR